MGAVCSCCCSPEVEQSRACDVNDANYEFVEVGSRNAQSADCEVDDSDNDSDCDGYRTSSARHRAYKNSHSAEEDVVNSPGADELQKRYILYPDPESPRSGDSAAKQLWEERMAFLKARPRLARMILEDLNKVRTGNGLYVLNSGTDVKPYHLTTGNEQLPITERMLADLNCARAGRTMHPLTVSDRLSRVALQAWLERSEIPDGFVAIPGCAYNGFGCLTYYSPRTRPFELDCLSRALVHFFLQGGRAAETVFSVALNGCVLDEAMYFPSREERYTHRSNGVFHENAARFVPQLLDSECRSLGLYMDMVMTDELEASRNIVCVVLIFDKLAVKADPDCAGLS